MSKLRKSTFWIFLLTGVLITLIIVFILTVNNTAEYSHFARSPLPTLKTPNLLLSSENGARYGSDEYKDKTLYPPPWLLLNLQMKFLVNNDICQQQDILLMVLITSHAGDVEFRQKIRETFPLSELKKLKIRRAFILGKTENSLPSGKYKKVSLEETLQENEKHSDLIVGDFLESYRNLTYKHLLGLTWATRYCAQAKYIVKQDDDVIVDFYQLVGMLHKVESSLLNSNAVMTAEHEFIQRIQMQTTNLDTRFIMGKNLINYPVIRDEHSKWFVHKSDFENDSYPNFVSGWAYITTIETVLDILKVSQDVKYFWIDDVYVTGILREKANIQILDLSKLFTQYKGQLLCCLNPLTIKSKSNEPFWCDFIIGPSNDNLEIFTRLQQHSRFCYTSQLCVRRSWKEELNKTCVVTDLSSQNPYSQVKGQAVWHAVKL